MLIQGQSTAISNGFGQAAERLMTGLRIDGQLTNASADSNPASESQVSVSFSTITYGSASGSARKNFETEILSRLLADLTEDSAPAILLADSLSSAALEVSSKFGQDKANEFMVRILKATDGSVSEQALIVAVSSFFGQIKAMAVSSPELFGQLEKMKDFLNQGLDLALDESQLESRLKLGDKPQLSYSLNKYFNTPATLSEDKNSAETYGFNANFERVALKVEAAGEDSYGSGFFKIYSFRYLSQRGFTPEGGLLSEMASFLRDSIGNSEAADYLQENGIADFLGSVSTVVSVVAKENGREAAKSLISYLNQNVAPEAKSADGNVRIRGWHLGRDYANPDLEVPAERGERPDISSFGISSGEAEDLLKLKGHQGLSINSVDKNGVVCGTAVDLNELYDAYKNAVISHGGGNLNSPFGHLVNTVA
ncbi:MAG: hypothetical protein LBP22_01650 [Deltaproteobacteria bacterium]|jgi:hypothetical protein|nr:hypothetical protein [Deltaproteobacteria bacterium]